MCSSDLLRTYSPDPSDSSKTVKLNDYEAETGTDVVRWGGVGTVSFAWNPRHKLSLTGLFSRAAEIEGREVAGYNEESSTRIADTRLRFVSRALAVGQLRGEHELPALHGASLAWHLQASRATLAEPDTRQNVYAQDATFGASWMEGTLSGLH